MTAFVEHNFLLYLIFNEMELDLFLFLLLRTCGIDKKLRIHIFFHICKIT